MAEKHVIKKYANRKLYDTRTSRYITLDGISELMRDGHQVEVIDRETGRDLTPLIISQVVVGEEKRGSAPGFQVLRQVLEGAREISQVPVDLVTGELDRRRNDFEEQVNAAIERALERLSLPSRREVERLTQKVDELSRKLDRLGERSGPAPKSATAEKRAVKSTRTRTAAARR